MYCVMEKEQYLKGRKENAVNLDLWTEGGGDDWTFRGAQEQLILLRPLAPQKSLFFFLILWAKWVHWLSTLSRPTSSFYFLICSAEYYNSHLWALILSAFNSLFFIIIISQGHQPWAVIPQFFHVPTSTYPRSIVTASQIPRANLTFVKVNS